MIDLHSVTIHDTHPPHNNTTSTFFTLLNFELTRIITELKTHHKSAFN